VVKGGLRFFLGVLALSLAACSTSDKARLKESRDAFLQGDNAKAETALYTPEVYQNDQNRLLHYYLLSSVAMSEGLYEKAAYFLNKARTQANSVRSSSGTFDWFSSDYRSNPIEYSYIHYLLVMSYSMLAQEGKSPAWSTPEIKDEKGNVLVAAQNFPARSFSPSEIADFRQKARAELLAWDSHLQNLKRTYPTEKFYKEDLWARLLASFIHASSTDHNEMRTGELLTRDAEKVFQTEFNRYPSKAENQAEIESLIQHLRARAQGKDHGHDEDLFVLEAGVMSLYKIKRFHLGLSTLMGLVKDPGLRMMMEQIGMNVIMNTAPEFGLVLFAGGLAGSVGNGNGGSDDEFDGPPQFFTDAVDRSFGFEVRFPTIQLPPPDTHVDLELSTTGKTLPMIHLPVLSPLQEMISVELKEREQKEMFARAVKIGIQYVAVLIPAIKAYQKASREGNIFEKIAIIAGYYLSKKAIDRANNPDLRSWNYLPKLIAANLISVAPGDYQAKVTIDNSFGKYEKSLGTLSFGKASSSILYERVGDVPILNRTVSNSTYGRAKPRP